MLFLIKRFFTFTLSKTIHHIHISCFISTISLLGFIKMQSTPIPNTIFYIFIFISHKNPLPATNCYYPSIILFTPFCYQKHTKNWKKNYFVIIQWFMLNPLFIIFFTLLIPFHNQNLLNFYIPIFIYINKDYVEKLKPSKH